MSTTDWKTQTEIANETGKILVNTNDNNDCVCIIIGFYADKSQIRVVPREVIMS